MTDYTPKPMYEPMGGNYLPRLTVPDTVRFLGMMKAYYQILGLVFDVRLRLALDQIRHEMKRND